MNFTAIVLNTEDEILNKVISSYNDDIRTLAVIKRYTNCPQFLRKKVLCEFGEFEYVGYYEYDAETRLYVFRACSKSRKKNKHDISMGLLDVTRNLEIITGDFWIVRANLNSYKPADITVDTWNEYRLPDNSDDSASKSEDDDDEESLDNAEYASGINSNVEDESSDDDLVASDVILSDDDSDDSDDSEEDDSEVASDDELAMTKQFKKIQNHSKRGGSNNKKGHVSNEELQMMSQDDPIGGDGGDDDEKSGDEDKSYGDGAEDDILEEIFDEEPVKAPKKSKSSKNKSCITNLDTTLLSKVAKLSTILKPEDTLTSIEDLDDKRMKVVNILATLDCSPDYARLIEMGVYNYSIAKCKIRELIPLWECNEFNEIYLTKAKSVYSNLNAKCYVGNVSLLEKVKNGEIKPELVGLLPPSDVFPERWNHIIQENQHREKLIYESTMAKTTDKFVCPNSKCRGRKCVYVEAQIRSADEPMTMFITCLLCGKRFQQ
jgi:DNA-directed RNA polymerase subunit M/transcription elongation factor TFIIS